MRSTQTSYKAFKLALAMTLAATAVACSKASDADNASISGTDKDGNQVLLWVYIKPDQKDAAGKAAADPQQCWYSATIKKDKTDIIAASKKDLPSKDDMKLLYPVLSASQLLNADGLGGKTSAYEAVFSGAATIVSEAAKLEQPKPPANPPAQETAPKVVEPAKEKPENVNASKDVINSIVNAAVASNPSVKKALEPLKSLLMEKLMSGKENKKGFFGELLPVLFGVGASVANAAIDDFAEKNKTNPLFAIGANFLGGLISGLKGGASLTSLEGSDAKTAYANEIEKAKANGTNFDQNAQLRDPENLKLIVDLLSKTPTAGNDKCDLAAVVVAKAQLVADAKPAAVQDVKAPAVPAASPEVLIISANQSGATIFYQEKLESPLIDCKVKADFKMSLQKPVNLDSPAGARIPVMIVKGSTTPSLSEVQMCGALSGAINDNATAWFYIDHSQWKAFK